MDVRLRWRVLGAAALAAVAFVYVGKSTLPWHARSVQGLKPPIPHEDPSVVRVDHDVATLLQFFGDAYAYNLAQQYMNARSLTSVLRHASIPENVRGLVGRIGAFVQDLTVGMEEAEDAVARAQALLRANRRAEATALLTQAGQLLRRDEILLGNNREGLRRLGDSLGILGLPSTAPERQSFARVERTLGDLDARERRIAGLLAQVKKGKVADLKLTSTSLQWSAPARGYPGMPFVVSGAVVTGGAYSDQPRHLVFTLDGRVIGDLLSRGRFRVELIPPGDFPSGYHALTLLAKPEGRYAGVSETRALELVRFPISVRISTAPTAWLPGSVVVTGDAHSRSGALRGAEVEAYLGNVRGVAWSGPGGTFKVAITPPVTLGLMGPQPIKVRVLPVEPRDAPVEAEASVFMVNPLSIGLTSVAFVPLIAVYARGRRRKREKEAGEVPDVHEILNVDAPLNKDVPFKATLPSVSGDLLDLYRDGVRRIEQRTGVPFQPYLTLREYQKAVSSSLNGHAFAQMTALAEPALYSRRPVTEEMLGAMRRFRQDLEEGLKAHA